MLVTARVGGVLGEPVGKLGQLFLMAIGISRNTSAMSCPQRYAETLIDVANDPPAEGFRVMFPVILLSWAGVPPLGSGLTDEYGETYKMGVPEVVNEGAQS